jgi:prevent-host-death family protein
MDAMPISQFKAQCLSVMDRVRRTGRPVRVTRYGRPVADVVPAGPAAITNRTLGFLKDATTIVGDPGDLVAPVGAAHLWNAIK